MPSYRVCFFNQIPRNNRLFRCCQRSIVIRRAHTPERAIEAAKKRFARAEGIRDWNIHASLIEIEPILLEGFAESTVNAATEAREDSVQSRTDSRRQPDVHSTHDHSETGSSSSPHRRRRRRGG
jgi:hypothetical protein